MDRARCLAAGFLLLVPFGPAFAANSRTPLRLVSDRADLVLEAPDPHHLVQAVLNLDLPRRLDAFTSYRDFLESTRWHRSLQLLAYLEKQLGAPWPQLLDRLAGDGALMALSFGSDPVPVLFVVQGTDEKLTEKFFRVALDVLEGELARQEGPARLSRGEYHGLGLAQVGTDWWLAQAGPALLLANSEQTLHEALDRHLDPHRKSLAESKRIQQSRQLLPSNPLARVWVSLDAAHTSAEAKNLYKIPRDDPQLTVLYGPYFDLTGRSPYVCAGLYPDAKGLLLSVRLPRGTEGMGDDSLLRLPPAGELGSRPLLAPKGVLYSSSDYFNFNRFWTDRSRLFKPTQVKGLEEFDKKTGQYLLGNRMSKLLQALAPYYRVVVVHQSRTTYKMMPEQPIPGFALVAQLREPQKAGATLEAALRGAAFLGGFKLKWKSTQEFHAGCKIVGWRFPENVRNPDDAKNFRFNFSPCFVRVGDQFLVSSTFELGRELVDLLQAEAKSKDRGLPAPAHSRIYAEGVAEILEAFRDRLLVKTVLDQAVTPDQAREQVQALIELVRSLGVLDLSTYYAPREFHYDLRLRVGKTTP